LDLFGLLDESDALVGDFCAELLAAGRAASELMSAAITEWSRRGGRVKLARLVAVAVGAIQAELTTGRA
jgi:hypothetical protein